MRWNLSRERHCLNITVCFHQGGKQGVARTPKGQVSTLMRVQEPGPSSSPQMADITPLSPEEPHGNIRLHDPLGPVRELDMKQRQVVANHQVHTEHKLQAHDSCHTHLDQRPPDTGNSVSPDCFSGQLRRTSTLQLTLGLLFVAGTGLHSPGQGHAPGVCAHLSLLLWEALAWLGTALPCPASSTRGSPRRAAEFGKR